LVPRRGRRTSQIIVALQGVSLRVKRRSGPESGPDLSIRSEWRFVACCPKLDGLAGLLPAQTGP